MDLLYVITLIVAMTAAGFALSINILALVRGDAHTAPTAAILRALLSHRVASAALALGSLSLMISVSVHSRWGHGPATVAPMDFRRLLSEHESFPTVGAILVLGLALTAYRKRRQCHVNAT